LTITVADRDAFSGALHFDHVARRLTPGVNGIRLELIFARGHQNVGKLMPAARMADADLPGRQRLRRERFQPQALGRASSRQTTAFGNQAALALRRARASRTSGSRSLPKYMSVLSMKMVGEPKPPRAITSSVLALTDP